MNSKELTAAAKAAAKAAGAYSAYAQERAAKRTAFDAETTRRTAELRTAMLAANRTYREALEEVAGGIPDEETERNEALRAGAAEEG